MGFFEVADKVWGALAGVTASILQSLKKKRDISLVVGEYRDKAVYKSGGNPNLVQLFSSKERLEEFVEHCKTGDISRDQAVGLFLYDVPCINGTNASAETFVLHFYDDVVAVLDKVDSNDAKALAAAVRRSNSSGARSGRML